MATDQSDVQSRSEVEPAEEVELIAPFSEEEMGQWIFAIGLVQEFMRATEAGEFVIPESEPEDSSLVPAKIRCHEIATAVGRILRLPVQTGWVGLRLFGRGGIEHSWLWTKPLPAEGEDPDAWTANILDPWVMGGYPRVQLVLCHPSLGQYGLRYQPGPAPRADVDLVQVERLVQFFRQYMDKVRARKKT